MVLHGILGEEQLEGASADAQSYWQGRFAACTFVAASLGLVGRGTVGALPQTPQGTLSLDPARGNCPLTPFRDWVGRTFMLLPRAAFEGLCLSPCLFPQLSVKSQKNEKGKRSRFDGILSPFPKLPCPLQGENDYRLPPFQPQKPISSYVT